MKFILCFGFLIGAVVSSETCWAQDAAPAALASSALATLKEADVSYDGRAELNSAKKALDLYEKAIAEDPSFIEPYWKLTRVTWWIAELTDSAKAKVALYEKGIAAAKKALMLDPKCYQAHFWLGVNYGSLGEAKGVLKSLFLVKPIRKEMEEVNRLNPSFEAGGALRTLGVVNYKVPGFAGGSKKKALEQLNAAFATAPNDPYNVYYLFEYYFTVGEKDKARTWLTALESLTPPSDSVPDYQLLLEKAKPFAVKLK